MASSKRPLDIVLLGATGYTGECTAEHIVHNLPMHLKWGLAGRSSEKLHRLAAELKKQKPDRDSPEILAVDLNEKDLERLARKTKVLINCVGPYHIYSTPVVKACAEAGTHYLDVTGETPWVKEMIDRFDDIARHTGAIMIPTIGFESAPSDLLTWSMAKTIKDRFGVRVKNVILSVYDLKLSGVSGGTAATVLAACSNLSFKDILALRDPYILSAARPTQTPSTPLSQTILGAHHVRDIGTVTTAIMAACDTAVVHRTSSLMPELYDRNFNFQEFGKARNMFIGVVIHLVIAFAGMALLFPPVRWLAKKFLPEPGKGPTKEERKADYVEYRGIATAESPQVGKKPIRLMGRLSYAGASYPMTGMLLAEAAMVLLTSKRVKSEVKGGYLTPAVLGEDFIRRMENCGVQVETKILEN